MRIIHNGDARETEAATLGELLGSVPPGCAIAVNGQVLPRAGVADHRLHDGDHVEVVTAVAGG